MENSFEISLKATPLIVLERCSAAVFYNNYIEIEEVRAEIKVRVGLGCQRLPEVSLINNSFLSMAGLSVTKC